MKKPKPGEIVITPKGDVVIGAPTAVSIAKPPPEPKEDD